MGNPDLQCGRCYQHMERDPNYKPICHYKACPVSEYMLDQYEPYVETFFSLRSELASRAGFGEYIMRECQIEGPEIELFLGLDAAGIETRENQRKAEQKTRQVSQVSKRR